MLSQKLRRSFLAYFKSQGHAILPSSSVVPHDDPTLLFINAGMNQFKDVFLGKSKRDYTRAATTQKCIRVGGKHNDLDNVGHTTRHLTFFEMLGNFSFGDYFKKEAIAYAWDIATHIFAFDPDKIWVSVYKDDDEAFALWEKHISSHRIVRFGEKENFWAMGETGPCGPCSELLFDRGEKYGPAKNPKEDFSGERYLEFWNLVFMQFSKDASGKMEPLPKKSIDTGSGLERVASLKLEVDSVFQTDILRGLIAEVETISGKTYDLQNTTLAPAFHVIADHIRSLSFAITEILTLEEEAFIRTLQRGGQLLGQVIERSQKEAQKITGEDAFKLKDTYGFPLEEIQLIAKDENLDVDLKRFQELEDEAKNKSRKAHKTEAQKFDPNFFADFTKTHFDGYQHTSTESKLLGIVMGGQFVSHIESGQEGILLLDKTPFYPEMGGQVGDTGEIEKGTNAFQVYDTTAPFPGVIAHLGKMGSGTLKKNDQVVASIDVKRRVEIRNNHTATHLLHWALQKVLGPHIKQAGSLVDPKRLRFDFSHHKPVS